MKKQLLQEINRTKEIMGLVGEQESSRKLSSSSPKFGYHDKEGNVIKQPDKKEETDTTKEGPEEIKCPCSMLDDTVKKTIVFKSTMTYVGSSPIAKTKKQWKESGSDEGRKLFCRIKCGDWQKENCPNTGKKATLEEPPKNIVVNVKGTAKCRPIKSNELSAWTKRKKENLEKKRRDALSPEERTKEDNLIAQKKADAEFDATPNKKPENKVERMKSWVRIKDLGKHRVQVTAKGEFPVNVTEGGLSDKFIANVLETIKDNPQGKEILDSGNMNITFAHIKGSASNYFNGPVKPSHGNDQKTPRLKDDSFYTGSEEKNNKLALKRGQNLFLELQKKLPAEGVNISAKPKFEERITDTGGVYDEWRDVSKYPRGGQFVIVNATMEMIPLEIIEEIQCLTDMKVTVGYYAPMKGLDEQLAKAKGDYLERVKKSITHSKKMNKGREGLGGHQCNQAKFAVWLNNAKIGVVNLNNGGGGQPAPNDDKFPDFPGGSRQGTLVVKIDSRRT